MEPHLQAALCDIGIDVVVPGTPLYPRVCATGRDVPDLALETQLEEAHCMHIQLWHQDTPHQSSVPEHLPVLHVQPEFCQAVHHAVYGHHEAAQHSRADPQRLHDTLGATLAQQHHLQAAHG